MKTDRATRPAPGYNRAGRQARKADMDFSYAIGDGIDLLNPAHWDAVTDGQSRLLRRGYCRLMENEGPRSVKCRYGLVYRKDEPVAAVAVRIAPLRDAVARPDLRATRRTQSFRNQHAAEPAPEMAWQAPSRRMMLCGDFYASGFHGIALRGAEDIGKLWPGITALLSKIQAQEGLQRDRDYILIKDVPSMPAAETRALRYQQYRRFETSPYMAFDLSPRWTSYEDYLAQLNVRYRLVAHRTARELYRQGIEGCRLGHLGPWAHRVHELCSKVQRRSGVSHIPLPKDLLPALAHHLDASEYRCSGLFQDDNLVGFAMVVRDRDTAVCYAAGWDTEPGLPPLLPPLLHAAIRDAMDMGCRRVNFGRTALRIKTQLGAYPEQTELWVQHARPELGIPVSTILETVSHAPKGDEASPLPI